MKLAVVSVLVSVLAAPAVADAQALLPDLVERPPQQIGVETDPGPTYRLGFDSGAGNSGAGPLIVQGHGDGSGADMSATQVIENSDGTTTTRPGVGVLHFDTDPTHNHWHYLGFESYQLVRPADRAVVAPDHKEGFCLTDDYWVQGQPPGGAVFTDDCGSGQPNATDITEGISVGWGDEYVPQKDGQFIDITAVPAGYYDLVNRVNAAGLLLESDTAGDMNDASSALVSIEWPNGPSRAPQATVLSSCQSTDTCTLAPTVSTGAATGAGARTETATGSLDAYGLPASYRFDFGRTSAYGQSGAWQTAAPGPGLSTVSESLQGLAPATTYHYRLVAKSAAGTSFGADAEFTTSAAGVAPNGTAGTSRAFRIRSVRAIAGGDVKLTVETPSAGRLHAGGSAVAVGARAKRRPLGMEGASLRVGGAGVFSLVIRPSGALRALLERAAAPVARITVTFVVGRRSRAAQTSVVLRRPRRKAHRAPPAPCGALCFGFPGLTGR